MPNGQPRRRRRLLRHRVHMYAYASISLALMIMGLVFSGFAIFKRDSELSKIWLAGPTTIAVGLVLCGKVIIDCRPRESVDEEDCYDNDMEIPYIAAPVEQEKSVAMTAESKYGQGLVTDNCLIAENHVLGNHDSCNHNTPMHLGRVDLSEESQIWNLRDKCSSANAPFYDQNYHYQSQHDHQLCLHNSCARITKEVTCKYCQHSHPCMDTIPDHSHCQTRPMHPNYNCSPYQCDHSQPICHHFPTSTSPQNRRSRCQNANDHMQPSSSLYQGEMFLINDKQYFV